MIGNMALKRFLDRRYSVATIPTPPIPQGRVDHAPLEMLSTVALKQLRYCISQEKEPVYTHQSLPISNGTSEVGGPFEGPSVWLSPVSSDDSQTPNLPFTHQSQNVSFSDTHRHRNPDVTDEQKHLQVDPRLVMSSFRNLSGQNSHSYCSSPGDKSVSSGRVMKPHAGTNTQASSKPRCQSSKFCHICSRTTRKVNSISCTNFRKGTCRKVVCQKCFLEYGWNWKAAIERLSEWSCTHCRDICPPRAQCAIYKRTNERRREQQQRLRHPRTFPGSENESPLELNGSAGKKEDDFSRVPSTDTVIVSPPLSAAL